MMIFQISRKFYLILFTLLTAFYLKRAAERRYSRVKRWLRDVDIFSKDYLIVPINQTAHWYIVLIQYHNNVPTEGDLISDDDDDSHGKIFVTDRILSHVFFI
jgi:Ulp1 family protease